MKIKSTNSFMQNDNQNDNQNHKRKHHWIKRILISIIILIIILISLIFIFNQQITEHYIKSHSQPTTYLKVPAKQMKENAKKANKHGNFNPKSAKPVSSYNLLQASLKNQNQPKIGGVSVPALGINLPILGDDGDYSMLYGAGPLQPNQVMGQGNYTLASHDMWTNVDYYSHTLLFTPLKQAQTGQDIYLTDKTHVYHYVINEVNKILPTQWDDTVNFSGGKPEVTLLTCDTNDKYRIMVRGKLVGIHKFDAQTAKPFESDYNQYKAYH